MSSGLAELIEKIRAAAALGDLRLAVESVADALEQLAGETYQADAKTAPVAASKRSKR